MERRGQLRFEEMIQSTVVRVLIEVFGETGASFIYVHLRRRGGLEKERISREMGKFSEGVMDMLGSGGLVLLNRIVEELAARVGVEIPKGLDLNFEEKLNIIATVHSGVMESNH